MVLAEIPYYRLRRVRISDNTVPSKHGHIPVSNSTFTVYYEGRFIHVDNIRPLDTRVHSLNRQKALKKQFAERKFLKLNVHKCEVIQFAFGSTQG